MLGTLLPSHVLRVDQHAKNVRHSAWNHRFHPALSVTSLVDALAIVHDIDGMLAFRGGQSSASAAT